MSSRVPDVAADETRNLIAASKVNGTAVYNRAGESLGSIHDVMIDKVSGQVAYAVMSFGGFLGIGDRLHPLPWTELTYDTSLRGYVVDVSRDQLQEAPSYHHDERPWSDPLFARRLADYYPTPWG
ncbi:MAG TPA: PRC-barrel domain-containing protein [Acetobacteraceae bacterium]|nr:PRC-barrel domain-containing protein [Acetobacteraceae bacterium]